MEWAPIALGFIGTAANFIGGQQQASALKRAEQRQMAAAEQSRRNANLNAAAIEAETAEMTRREREAANEAESLRRARAAAAGGMETGSTAVFLDTQSRREDEYIDWLGRSGRSQAAIAREGGEYAYQTGMASAAATGGQAASARFGSYASLGTGLGGLYDYYDRNLR